MRDFNEPILYYNSKLEDDLAFELIKNSGIRCELARLAEEPTPMLIVGFMRYFGVKEIEGYINDLKIERQRE